MTDRRITIGRALAMGALIGLLASLLGGRILGWFEARFDLARGTPRYMIYGLPGPAKEEDDFARRLYAKHHVKVERVAGCIVSSYEVDYWTTYNATILNSLGVREPP